LRLIALLTSVSQPTGRVRFPAGRETFAKITHV
jgi:hypothetical protein